MAQKKQTVRGKSKKGNTGKMVGTERKGQMSHKSRVKLDSQVMMILSICSVLFFILSYVTMGLITTLILILGIALIIGVSTLLRKINRNSKKRKVLNVLALIFLGLCIVVAILVGALLIYVVSTAPDFNPTQLSNKESSILYASNGEEYAKLGTELRENIKYEDLPQVFVDALVATEDSRFFQHNGFDAPRFLKASLGQALGRDAGGASTLSMQVIKNSFTSKEATGIKGIIRKFTDIYMAVFKLEKNYSKEQIIAFYVNNHSLGGIICGVEEAAQAYFGKSAKDMNLAEASLLAGMFQAPGSYVPTRYPEKASARRDTVLNLMVRHGYITKEVAEMTKKIPVESLLVDSSNTKNAEYQAYIDTVLDELNEKYKISYTQTPVLIYTNMDMAKQRGIDDIFNGVSYTWHNEKAQSGVGVVENSTGKLVAVGAGRNRPQRGLNYAQTKRQIGSTAKPLFDYGPGIEYNGWSTYQQFVDEPWSYTNGPSINNSSGDFAGQISIRDALAQSRNIPALKAFQSLDVSNIRTFVTGLGITPEEYLHEAHALGAFSGATPIEMAGAYAAFANGGYYTEPYTISKIVYRDTGEEVNIEPETKQVMSDSTAFMITDILKYAVNLPATISPSAAAKINGINIAAKTGSTNFDEATRNAKGIPAKAVHDAWVVGYDPDYSIGMWLGYKDISDGYDMDTVAGVQRKRLFSALGNVVFSKNGKDFSAPSSVVQVPIEVGTNPALLPSDNTPEGEITYEYFRAGTEPTDVSTKYLKLNNVENLKAEYDEKENEVTLSWSPLSPTPTGSESYGEFGYNIYYYNTLLGFTTDTTYKIATTFPEGTYKVVSAFKNYTVNQSSGTTFTLELEKKPNGEEEKPSNTYKGSLNGDQYIKLSVGGKFIDSNPPFSIINTKTKEEVADKAIKDGKVTTIIKNEDGEVVEEIDTSKVGIFTIQYKIDYDGYQTTLTRTVTIK